MTLEGSTYAATVEWVEGLVAASAALQATSFNFYTLNGELWIQVQGGHREAHAWQHAVGGHMMPSSVKGGVRRQLILGTRAHVELIDDPSKRTESGRAHLVLLAAVTGVGVAAWGWTHPTTHPNGATVVGVLAVAAAVGLLWVVQATVRGYWTLEGNSHRRTLKRMKATRQSEGSAHHQDAAS